MIAVLVFAAVAPACLPVRLRVAVSDDAGDFNGMSHAGAYLALRNVGPRACRTAALPILTFRDRHGRTLPTLRARPTGAGATRAHLPVTIPAGGVVRAGLRWTSGPVYPHSRCVDAASIRVALGGTRRAVTPVRAHLCGEAGQVIGFDQAPLR